MSTKKRRGSSKQVMKAFTKVVDEAKSRSEASEKLKPKVPKFEIDAFTENKGVNQILTEFATAAWKLRNQYNVRIKEMVVAVAKDLEEELIRIGKDNLVSSISEELIKILKQIGIGWNAIYIRRCLDAKYKNPADRANALARKPKEETRVIRYNIKDSGFVTLSNPKDYEIEDVEKYDRPTLIKIVRMYQKDDEMVREIARHSQARRDALEARIKELEKEKAELEGENAALRERTKGYEERYNRAIQRDLDFRYKKGFCTSCDNKVAKEDPERRYCSSHLKKFSGISRAMTRDLS